jgi:hypothetical protein
MPATEDDLVRLYSVQKLAELWEVSEYFVRCEIRAGRLPTVHLGRGDRDKARIRASDAARWVDRRQSGLDVVESGRSA